MSLDMSEVQVVMCIPGDGEYGLLCADAYSKGHSVRRLWTTASQWETSNDCHIVIVLRLWQHFSWSICMFHIRLKLLSCCSIWRTSFGTSSFTSSSSSLVCWTCSLWKRLCYGASGLLASSSSTSWSSSAKIALNMWVQAHYLHSWILRFSHAVGFNLSVVTEHWSGIWTYVSYLKGLRYIVIKDGKEVQ